MVAQAQAVLGNSVRVIGKTNTQAPPLLASPGDMQLAEQGVLQLGIQAEQVLRHLEQNGVIIIAAFSDPGLAILSERVSVPVLGIGQSTLQEAAMGERRFGIVTITPNSDLLASFYTQAATLGLSNLYCGARVTQGEAQQLLANPEQLDLALASAIDELINDGAQAVILGGGPLAAAAERLQPQFNVPLLNPVAAAARAAFKD
ncbi:aspartate/glutamate racemase family protein [Oceanisphaera sp. DM8]|uniref:Aspartate/glutamate racemase family protein n=2 Tax=Oceanisphaera pacifica TaxID=2818389 RepID=A0ABS3NGC3_9GAMM|nr:aspartate/glutamate racemase family protein [Oceanisphaera pacifica]